MAYSQPSAPIDSDIRKDAMTDAIVKIEQQRKAQQQQS